MTSKTKTAGTAVKGFGTAMKGIPFILILTALIEIAKAFYDVATNARQAQEAQIEVDKIAEAGAKTSSDRANKRAKEVAQAKVKTDQAVRTLKKTEAEGRLLNEAAIKSVRERAKVDRKGANDRARALQTDLDWLKKYSKSWNGIVMTGGGQSAAKFAKRLKNLGFDGLAKDIKAGSINGGDFQKMLTITQGKIQSSWAKWKIYNAEVEEYGFQMDEAKTQTFETNKQMADITANANNVTSGVKKINTEFKTQISLLDELNDLLTTNRELTEDISQLDQAEAIGGLEDEIAAETDVQKRSAEATGEIDVDLLESLILKKQKLREAAINQEANFEAKELKSKLARQQQQRRDALAREYEALKAGAIGHDAELETIEKNHQAELDKIKIVEEGENENAAMEEVIIFKEAKEEVLDIQRETNDEIKSINDELIDDQLTYAQKKAKILMDSMKGMNQAALDAIDAEKKMWQDRMDIADVATSVLTELSDKRMAKLDEEISEATKQADFLRTLAANGNIDAKDSLAEQQRIIDEANRKKIQEEKLKAKIEFANSVFQTYGAKIQAGSQSPLADTIKDVALLQQFIGSFTPTYLEGTEDTGTNGRGVDGKGGFQAILHPNERVLTKEQNKRVGGMNNNELARVAEEYQNGSLTADNATQIGNGWDSHLVVKRLESIENAIKNKPEHHLGVENVVIGAMDIVRTTKAGGDITYNRYRVKK